MAKVIDDNFILLDIDEDSEEFEHLIRAIELVINSDDPSITKFEC